MKQLLSLTLISFLFANSMAYAATPGAYAGLGLGYSEQKTGDFDREAKALGFKAKIGGLGGRIFAGYNFNDYLGLESGIAQYADSTYKADTFKSSFKLRALDVVGKAYLPVSNTGLNVYALGGAALVKSSSEAKNDIGSYSPHSATKVRPIVGLGASYDIPQTPLTTNFEFTRIVGKNEIPDANMTTLNISYKFGQ